MLVIIPNKQDGFGKENFVQNLRQIITELFTIRNRTGSSINILTIKLGLLQILRKI